MASTNEPLRRATRDVFDRWVAALSDRLGGEREALTVLGALEGAFVLCRAQRSTAPLLAAGGMVASLVARPATPAAGAEPAAGVAR